MIIYTPEHHLSVPGTFKKIDALLLHSLHVLQICIHMCGDRNVSDQSERTSQCNNSFYEHKNKREGISSRKIPRDLIHLLVKRQVGSFPNTHRESNCERS
jgi:hypothetical protein